MAALPSPELAVEAAALEEHGVRRDVDDLTFVEDEDAVTADQR
jgi:hypothetical protein